MSVLSSGSVDITVSGGDPAYNIVWTGPSNGDPSGNEIINSGGSYSVSSLVEGSYSFTITDDSGCFSTEVITLSEIVCSAPTVSLPVRLTIDIGLCKCRQLCYTSRCYVYE